MVFIIVIATAIVTTIIMVGIYQIITRATNKENTQLKQSVEASKNLVEKNRELYEEIREKHRGLKRKCAELYDQAECMKNPYSRESKDAVIDRLKKFNDTVQCRLREMM